MLFSKGQPWKKSEKQKAQYALERVPTPSPYVNHYGTMFSGYAEERKRDTFRPRFFKMFLVWRYGAWVLTKGKQVFSTSKGLDNIWRERQQSDKRECDL